MKPLKIFISSVQKEFESERKALAQYIRNDALLGTFFEVFLFKEWGTLWDYLIIYQTINNLL